MGDNSSTQSLSPGLCIVVIDLFMYYSQDLATNSLETIYFAPGGGVRSIVISLSVCLFVCPVAYLKNRTSRFHQTFFTCYLWPWLGPPLTATRYVMYFRFCVESKTTSMSRPVRPVAAPETKSAVSDCILLSRLLAAATFTRSDVIYFYVCRQFICFFFQKISPVYVDRRFQNVPPRFFNCKKAMCQFPSSAR